MVYLILLYIFPVISESVIPNSLGSYIRIRYINIQFCVISVSVISDSVILVSIISDSYLVISDSLYLIPLYQNPLYQIHCGRRKMGERETRTAHARAGARARSVSLIHRPASASRCPGFVRARGYSSQELGVDSKL